MGGRKEEKQDIEKIPPALIAAVVSVPIDSALIQTFHLHFWGTYRGGGGAPLSGRSFGLVRRCRLRLVHHLRFVRRYRRLWYRSSSVSFVVGIVRW
jgi:hypothetical protein